MHVCIYEYSFQFYCLKVVDTRWGSQFDCLQSVVKNRQLIETAIGDLRRENFAFRGRELMFIWDMGWWVMAQKIVSAYQPLRAYLALVEADGIRLGESVALALGHFATAETSLKTLSPGILI